MRQIIQDLKSGQTILEEVPVPQVRPGSVLIQTTRSLVSLGTERMLVEFGKANLIDKARQQPDKVKQVLDKIKSDGLIPTLEAVFTKLGLPLPLGYCNVGKIIAVGKGVTSFQIGDRVASNGTHAEVVCVPENLVAKIPDNVSDDEAAELSSRFELSGGQIENIARKVNVDAILKENDFSLNTLITYCESEHRNAFSSSKRIGFC